VTYLYRIRAAATWRSWLLLVVIMGVGCGVALASVAAARRTASAYPRYLHSARAPDMVVEPPFDPSEQDVGPAVRQRRSDAFLAGVRALPQVKAVSISRGTNATLPGADGLPDASRVIQALASIDGRYLVADRTALVAGRYPAPTRADEVLVDRNFARDLHAGPGATVRIWVQTDPSLAPDASPAELARGSVLDTLQVTGVGVMTDEVLQDDIARADRVVLTPAFARVHPTALSYVRGALQLRRGRRDVPAVQLAVQGIGAKVVPNGDVPIEVETTAVDRTQRAIRPLALALGAFGLLAALATLLVIGPELSRALRPPPGEPEVLRALGVTRAHGVAVAVLGAAVAGAGTLLVAVLVAAGLSPLAPIGVVRAVEPHPGPDLDWAVLLGGAAALAVLFVAMTGLDAVRADRVATRGSGVSTVATSGATSLGFKPSAVIGIGSALAPRGGPRAVPTRAAIAGMAFAVGFLTVVVTFGASLGHLGRDPALYGWRWDLLIHAESGYGETPLDQFGRQLSAIPGVAAATAVSYDKVSVDGTGVSALGLDDLIGRVNLSLVSGRMPSGPGEAVLGTSVLARLHRSVGQPVTVSEAGRSAPVRVVGSAAFPAIGRADAQRTGLGEGIAMTGPGISAIVPSSYPNGVLVHLQPGPPGRAAATELRSRYSAGLMQVLGQQRSADIVDYAGIGYAPVLLACILGLMAVAALVHTLAGSIRARRRDVALLRVLGFTQRQVLAAVRWQASVIVAVALLAGIPVGVIGGRIAWSSFADQVGVIAQPVVPLAVLGAIVAGALLLANVAASVPAWMAARTPAAAVLRSE
jgi:hypothetical protein